MHNIFCIHVGQCGVQLGFALWELLLAEHSITRDGLISRDRESYVGIIEPFFNRSMSDHFVPRGMFVDLEPNVIDQMRTGAFRNLYHPGQLISGSEDASNNFARGFHTVGRIMKNTCENRMRKEFEINDRVHAIHVFRSLGGGTGSGMTATIFEVLQDFAKMSKIEIPIHPSPHLSSAIVEPYNSILSEHFCMEDIDISTLIDNEALYDVVNKQLDMKEPNLHCINRLIAQVLSSFSSSLRFENYLDNDFTSLTNLVPYPRIHFPLVSYAPFASEGKLMRSMNTVIEMTKACFDVDNQMVKCDPINGKYMSCSMLYRGSDISPTQIYNALGEIKMNRVIRFVDWCPTGFKVGIVNQSPTIIPESKMGQTDRDVVMMTNTSAVSALWHRLAQKFHKLYAKRSFVHWFVAEGLEESEFCESLYNIATLAKDYEEVALDTKFDNTMDGIGEGDMGVGEGGEGGQMGQYGGEGGGNTIKVPVSTGDGGKKSKEISEDTDDADDEMNENENNAINLVRNIMNNNSFKHAIDWKQQFKLLMKSINCNKEIQDTEMSTNAILSSHTRDNTISKYCKKNKPIINKKNKMVTHSTNDKSSKQKTTISEHGFTTFTSQPSIQQEVDSIGSDDAVNEQDDLESLEEFATTSLMEDLIRKTSISANNNNSCVNRKLKLY